MQAKPCPFCGCNHIYFTNCEDWAGVQCLTCNASTIQLIATLDGWVDLDEAEIQPEHVQDQIIARWNTRVEEVE